MYRAGFRDVSSERHEVGMRQNSVGNIDSEVVGRIACASLRHEDEVPRTTVSRSRVCGTRQGDKKARCRCEKRKPFHNNFSEASSEQRVSFRKRIGQMESNLEAFQRLSGDPIMGSLGQGTCPDLL
jgi:hypothetical protein